MTALDVEEMASDREAERRFDASDARLGMVAAYLAGAFTVFVALLLDLIG